MVRIVDRTASRVFAGPCDAKDDNGARCRWTLYAPPSPRFDSDHERTLWEQDNPIVCDGYRPPYSRDHDDLTEPCHTEHARTDRTAWMLADLEDRLLPLSMWQDALPELMPEIAWPSRSTWWRWAKNDTNRRALEPRTVIDGVEFFRGGDVIDLCMREQQRIRGNRQREARTRRSA
jgi:hypothetical protein